MFTQKVQHNCFHIVGVKTKDHITDKFENLRLPFIKNCVSLLAVGPFGGETNLDAFPTTCQESQRWIADFFKLGDDRVEAFVQTTFAFAPCANNPTRNHAGVTTSGSKIGQDRALHHVLHFMWHAWHGVNHFVADRTHQARCSAPSLVNHCGPNRHHCLLQIVVGHASTTGFKNVTDHLRNIVVHDKFDAHDFGDCFTSQVIVSWPESATHNHSICFAQSRAHNINNALMVVAYFDLQQRINSIRG